MPTYHPHPTQTNKQHLLQLGSAVSFINANLTKDLNLEVIAREAKMSKSYFSTIFKNMTPVRTVRYVRECRTALGHIQEVEYITSIAI